jgi:hypothetical protein
MERENKMRSKFDEYFKTHSGPIAVVRVCTICGHIEKIAVGVPGVGRGYGMREGNKARGRIIQHIKTHFNRKGELKNDK